MKKSAIHSRHGLHAALENDHEKLERRFEAMLEEMRAGTPSGRSDEWTRLEDALLSHFDAEEHYLLPVFEAHDPDSATAILDEHQAIRARVRELGIAVDLRVVSEQSVRELVQMLRDHAAREEKLYAFASRCLDDDAARSVLERLRG